MKEKGGVYKLLIYKLLQHSKMNSFNPYTMCYQFWMVPNLVPQRRTYYPPITFFPQMLNTQVNNLIIQNMVPIQGASLTPQQPRSLEQHQPKPSSTEPESKNEVQKITVQTETSPARVAVKKVQFKKANRPLTYLTEKAFYLKQKLKEKQNNGIRILRKRLKIKQIRMAKSLEQAKSTKNGTESGQTIKKRLPIAKDSQKQHKVIAKIRQRLARQNMNQYAQTPIPISGVAELNQFCRLKYENLMLRQVNQL